jgi:perosamine synthetase
VLRDIENRASQLMYNMQDYYGDQNIPLHRPSFKGNEKAYLHECIDSNFVSSSGGFVDKFEDAFAKWVGVKYAVSTNSGTSALHVGLLGAGVRPGTEVITQALTFVATANSIRYCGAEPIFLDVDLDTLGLSPYDVKNFLQKNVHLKNGVATNKNTGREISCCLPMHTYGHPSRASELRVICDNYGIPVVEDCAESLGSFVSNQHTGSVGVAAVFSFNGNKIITTGGGGVVVTASETIYNRVRYLSTTAKKTHKYEFYHTEQGYNYRMPSLNAALGLAQLEQLNNFLYEKKINYMNYQKLCEDLDFTLISERIDTSSNHWLNCIKLENIRERNYFLEFTNERNFMSRPCWELMVDLEMFKGCYQSALVNSRHLRDVIVCLPSSVR